MSQPRTNPTAKQKTEMQKEVDRLVATFTPVGVAKIAGIKLHTVQSWIARGRVSAKEAHRISQIKMIKGAGFTRESLRPDIKFWIQDLD